jgi:hypothetical protein
VASCLDLGKERLSLFLLIASTSYRDPSTDCVMDSGNGPLILSGYLKDVENIVPVLPSYAT